MSHSAKMTPGPQSAFVQFAGLGRIQYRVAWGASASKVMSWLHRQAPVGQKIGEQWYKRVEFCVQPAPGYRGEWIATVEYEPI